MSEDPSASFPRELDPEANVPALPRSPSGPGRASAVDRLLRPALALPALSRALTSDPFVRKARERVWKHLHAKRVNHVKVRASSAKENAEHLDELFGKGCWAVVHDQLFYLEDHVEAQIAAAREVLSRAEPLLNRTDPRSTRAWKLYRTDPNEVLVEELPEGEAASAIADAQAAGVPTATVEQNAEPAP